MESHRVTASFFGVTLEARFPSPRLYAADEFSSIAQKYAQEFVSPRGKVQGVRVVTNNSPFDYIFTAPLFDQGAAISIDAHRFAVTIADGVNETDASLISSAIIDAFSLMKLPERTTRRLTVHLHGEFAEPLAAKTIFNREVNGIRFHDCGFIGKLSLPDWPEVIALNYEPSLRVPGGVFVKWDTAFRDSAPLDLATFEQARIAFGDAAVKCGLEIAIK